MLRRNNLADIDDSETFGREIIFFDSPAPLYNNHWMRDSIEDAFLFEILHFNGILEMLFSLVRSATKRFCLEGSH